MDLISKRDRPARSADHRRAIRAKQKWFCPDFVLICDTPAAFRRNACPPNAVYTLAILRNIGKVVEALG